jgi:hypothetical protein
MLGFKLSPQVNIIKTILLRAKYIINNTTFRNAFGVLIYNKMKLEFEPSSKIILNDARLEVGVSWARSNPFKGFLKMGKNARLIVNGPFRIFDRCVLYINENATLELGRNSFVNSNALF